MRMRGIDALQCRMHLGHAAEHPVKGGILHHQHDDVLDGQA
jgi:hypothetical protein